MLQNYAIIKTSTLISLQIKKSCKNTNSVVSIPRSLFNDGVWEICLYMSKFLLGNIILSNIARQLYQEIRTGFDLNMYYITLKLWKII